MPRPERDGAPPDWAKIDQSLCELYGWTPQQIDAMTLPEIRVGLTRPDDPSKGQSWDKLTVARLKDRLTPAERLIAMALALDQIQA